MTIDAPPGGPSPASSPLPSPSAAPSTASGTRSLVDEAQAGLKGARRLGVKAWPVVRAFGRGLLDAWATDWTLSGPTVMSWPGPSKRTWAIRFAAIVLVALMAYQMLVELDFSVSARGWTAAIALPLSTLPLLLLPAGPLIAWRLSSVAGLVLLFWPGADYAVWPATWYVPYLLLTVFTAARVRGAITAGMCSVMMLLTWLGARNLYDSYVEEKATGAVYGLVLALVPLCLVGFAWHTWRSAKVETDASRAVVAEGEEHRAVLLERARIARELHDIVTHHMSAIAVQAQAAPLADPGLSEPSREAFAAIERTARQSLTDLRAAIGVLREDGTIESRQPQPTLGQLPDLVAQARQSGQRVDYGLQLRQELPEPLSIAAYRIVQESLTNALRHAPAEQVTVDVRLVTDELAILVRNDLPEGAEVGPQGHGIGGMRERAAALGGRIEAGEEEGAFVVAATVPVPPEAGA